MGHLLPALISSSGSSYLGPGSQGIHRVNRDDDGIGNHNQGGNQDRDGNSDGADNCSKGYNPPQTDTDEAGAGTTLLSDMVATADRSALGDRRRVDAFGSWPGCKPRAPVSFAAMQSLKEAGRNHPMPSTAEAADGTGVPYGSSFLYSLGDSMLHRRELGRLVVGGLTPLRLASHPQNSSTNAERYSRVTSAVLGTSTASLALPIDGRLASDIVLQVSASGQEVPGAEDME